MNGQVVIMDRGRVSLKIMTDDHGERALRLAKAIRRLSNPPKPCEVHRLAIALGFGAPSSLVMQSRVANDVHFCLEDGDEVDQTMHLDMGIIVITSELDPADVPAEYGQRALFNDPGFCPYVKGIPGILEVVRFH